MFNLRAITNRRGISTVISTIIVSSVLLIILVASSYVSMNILELQMASTEFEQAKTNMMLLDEIVQDVALRRGSGGYVQFNQRGGGISITEHTGKISIYLNGKPIYNSSPLLSLDYRGGSRASSVDMAIRGNNSLIIRGLDASLSYLRVETDQGLWIRLDYDRVRIVEMGTLVVNGTIHNFIGITFLRLEQGNVGGSEIVNVKVQNIGVNTTSHMLNEGNVSIQAKLDSRTESYSFSSGATKSVVVIIEIQLKISID